MNNIKYFFQFFVIIFLFCLYKILGIKISSIISGYIFYIFGPLFRSNNLAEKNLVKALPNSSAINRKKILKKMWFNYGRIFSEYMYLKMHPNYIGSNVVAGNFSFKRLERLPP